jgi:hypothetical protein
MHTRAAVSVSNSYVASDGGMESIVLEAFQEASR